MHPIARNVSRPERPLRVLIAPDSFKGSVSARDVARGVAEGWLTERPGDEVVRIPLADGGEGTLDAIVHANPNATVVPVAAPVPDPLGRPGTGRWVRLGDTAVVELADSCGLAHVPDPDPHTARQAASDGLGVVIAEAWTTGVERLVVAIGGSASTDGGLGVLRALGLVVRDPDGRPVLGGGGDLHRIAALDPSRLTARTPVLVLTDVTAPLFGPAGAARVFAPQKGADAPTVDALDAGLRRWAQLWARHGVSPSVARAPGAGAAGGIGFGMAAGLNARLTSGADWMFEHTGLPAALAVADVLITGEGGFDAQSLTGKLVGRLLDVPGPTERWVVAGRVGDAPRVPAGVVSLSELAGGPAAALADPHRWLVEAGRQVARAGRSGLR